MAEIPRAALDYVTDQINALSASAQAAVLRVLESVEWAPENVARCREVVVEALSLVLPTYTDSSAQAAADFYDACRLDSVGEALEANAISGYDADATEGAVRALAQRVVDGGDVGSFNRAVLDRVDYEVKRAAGTSMVQNAAADPLNPRYARVPAGAETCDFCVMLASRGFVYHSERSAGAIDHYHANCDCRVVCSWDSSGVEGYDPDAYYALWKESERLKESGMPAKQREAVLAAMRDKLMPQFSGSQTELASLYDDGLRSAWDAFKKLGKTTDAYQRTVGTYLGEIGSACGGDFSAEYLARPDGEEIWAALRLLDVSESIRFRYATTEHKSPDFLVDGVLLELKTPQSERKVTRRLLEINRQFEEYPDEPKVGALSLLNLDVDVDSVVGIAQRFVYDGTLDTVYVIPKSGEVKKIER